MVGQVILPPANAAILKREKGTAIGGMTIGATWKSGDGAYHHSAAGLAE